MQIFQSLLLCRSSIPRSFGVNRFRYASTLLIFLSLMCLVFVLTADKWDLLQYPFTRNVMDGKIQDVQDGEEYLKLTEPGGFLIVPEHTGLILCSDGVQLFHSAKQSI